MTDNVDVYYSRTTGWPVAPLAHDVLRRHGVAGPADRPTADALPLQAWHAGSKAVDATGAPLVLYHGAATPFDAFEVPFRGAYFSSDETVAQAYAEYAASEGRGATPHVKPVYLAVRNPLVVNMRGATYTQRRFEREIVKAKAAGHDGLHFRNVDDMPWGTSTTRSDVWVVFSPNQIKSVGNVGTFDAQNPDIRFARTEAATLPPVRHSPPPAFAFGAPGATPMDADTLRARLQACVDAIDAEGLADEYADAHERYLHGECHVFALALHARTKAPLWAAIETDGERAGCLIHAFVEADVGVIDVLGLRSREAMLQDFDVWAPAFQPIEPEALAQLGAAMSLAELGPDIDVAHDVAAGVVRIADLQRRFAAQANFEAWHAGSKAVTADGRPLVAFHGTASDFSVFEEVAEGIDGIFFSSSPEIAAEYANWRGTAAGGAAIYPVHLAIRNPLEVTDLRSFDAHEFQMRIFDAQEAGHDGVVFRDVRDGWDSHTRADTWVAFHPTQIKSVFNAGSYAPGNPDIRFARDRSRLLPTASNCEGLGHRKTDPDRYELGSP